MKEKYLKKKLENLVLEFKDYGYTFTSFENSKYGNYKKEDADWNDKDLLHIKHVHSNIEAINTFITDKFASTIQFIKVPILFNMEFPIVVLNYDHKGYSNTFVATFGPYVLNMEKRMVDHLAGCVTYQKFYCGTKVSLFKLLLPLVKIFLKKNNQFTYSEDLPMRLHRNDLRKKNHYFKNDMKKFSYVESLNLKDQKVFLKEGMIEEINLDNIYEDKIIKKEDAGLLSFHIIKELNLYKIYSSICHHEGAYLCPTKSRETIKCPWHGLMHQPILKIKDHKVISSNNSIYNFNFNWPILQITLKQ